MPKNKIIGIVMLVVGVVVLVWAYNTSSSVSSQLGQTFSGSMNWKVIVGYVAGGLLVSAGIKKIV